MSGLSRRHLLVGTGATAGLAFLSSRLEWAAAATGNPFTLGVASGDPLSDRVIIWTRLAVDPFAVASPGGMGTAPVDVAWEVAKDTAFASVVRSGTATTTAAGGYAAHVDVTGLAAGTAYYYRFHTRSGTTTYTSPVGVTRTAPALGTKPAGLKFLTASCARYDEGYYHAYQAMAEDRPDLILFLGDYIYEYPTETGAIRPLRSIPKIAGPDSRGSAYVDTLVEYRMRHAEHKTDKQLQAAHAAAPWLVVYDDHEVRNNWYAENTADTTLDRKQAAFQAWYENMPVRMAPPAAGSIASYRRVPWGTLARFDMLDTRQYRDKQAGALACSVIDDAGRTLVGNAQEKWLLDGFKDHTPQWNLIGQQVFFSPKQNSTNHCDVNTDAWDGYRPERDAVANGWVAAGVRNPVVLTGDVHRHYAANVCRTSNLNDPIGAELITTSISSTGIRGTEGDPTISASPNVLYGKNWRGYIRCTVTASALTADFRCVDDVNKASYADVRVFTDKTFVVQDGARRLTPA
ncbi:alkaline phosphatase D family protein [Luteipulveratus sp. YIM 133132]|uniref:alkaline phosphatase D family protein n=1 Tax=Luteipulveratus flavus TaxID=3031728 RepID=UPI0023AF21E1|nr:alkaline phosphatase D family protein [Luteipulveratus sp. YIM 133132]MDE9366114.1 alkaline phosphatase D family protein [Luteipulveratus sp. YIM 133132]